MGRSISLFSGYDQKENRTTNYCLLILKMMYDEDPRLLSDFLTTIGGEDLGNQVGVKFTQQQRTGSSVPDGVIRQRSFTIYLEAKNYNWFYDGQLEEHLDSLYREAADARVLLALGYFESEEKVEEQFGPIAARCARKGVWFRAISFEEFYRALPGDRLPKGLQETLEEFRTYLDGQGLLPSWQGKLDVVNCARQPRDLLDHNVYMCPAEGGAYSHRRCEYFGMYAGQKTVERVALIRAVVDVLDGATGTLLWKNVQEATEALEQEAVDKVRSIRDQYPMRVFLLGELYPTTFSKDTPGGLQSSKTYFDLSSRGLQSAQEVAAYLDGKPWKAFPRWS